MSETFAGLSYDNLAALVPSGSGAGINIIRLVGNDGVDYPAPADLDISGPLAAWNPLDSEVSALNVAGVDTIRFVVAPLVGDFPLIIYTKK